MSPCTRTNALSEVTELAAALIRIDTAAPTGKEGVAARMLADMPDAAGADVCLHPLARGRDSLVARIPGSDPAEPALLFSGHLDTVPADEATWHGDPLEPRLDGERLVGLGASDMKCAVAAMALAVVDAAGRRRRRSIMLAVTAGEETECRGAASIAAELARHPIGAVVIGEPTCGRVAVAHKGVAWLGLETNGVAGHASSAPERDNAALRMAHALVRLAADGPLSASDALLGAPTAAVTKLEAGGAPNVIPARCRATLDVRLVPGFDASVAMHEIQRRVGPGGHYRTPRRPGPDPVEQRRPLGPVRPSSSSTRASRSGCRTSPTPPCSPPPWAIPRPWCTARDPAQAHAADESCSVAAMTDALARYRWMAAAWQTASTTGARHAEAMV